MTKFQAMGVLLCLMRWMWLESKDYRFLRDGFSRWFYRTMCWCLIVIGGITIAFGLFEARAHGW